MIHKSPSDLGLLIDGDNWRPHQYESIQNSRGSIKRFVGQCAPVGSGKSLSLVGEAIASGARTLILTGTRELQQRYSEEFKYLNMLDIRGKSNYICRAMEVGGEYYDGTPAKSVAEGPCQFGEECGLRLSGCTYYDRVTQAKYRKLINSNYAAWISANMYTEGWGRFDLVCCDEAHLAETWLSKMLAVKLPRCYGNLLTTKMPNNTNIAMWVNWAAREWPVVKAAVKAEKKSILSNPRKRITKLRTYQSLDISLSKMKGMTSEWKAFPDKSHILFQPIWIHDYAESLLFNHAKKVVFASSTIVPNSLRLLGITDNDMDFFSYPSTFPVERRPIYYHPVVKMRHGMPEEEKQKCVDVVDSFISARLDRKGFIATPSHALVEVFRKYSRYANLMVVSSPSYATATSTSSASMALQRFRALSPPCILIGPSWNTGTDLAYKQAEYTIIPKVPFADITDPLHIARSEDNPDYGWYDAGMKLTQMIGRAMRAEDDQNECLVTDKTFGAFLANYRPMIPSWVHAAIRLVRELPRPLEKL